MQKARIGISVGLMGAGIYFIGLFAGYIAVLLLSGYVLLVEDNIWLRRCAVKAVTLMISFSVIAALLNLIPDMISFLDNIAAIFGQNVSALILTKLVSAVLIVMEIIRIILFLLLGFKAIHQGTIHLPVIDKTVDRIFGMESENGDQIGLS